MSDSPTSDTPPPMRTPGAGLRLAAAAGLAATVLAGAISADPPRATPPRPADGTPGEDTVDPAAWGRKYPRQYASFCRAAEPARTRHGGSEPFSHLDRNPHLRRLFAGHPFGREYREERGHAFMLSDTDETKRVTEVKQPGACLHCHSSVLPAYRREGDGDIARGFERVCAMPLAEARRLVTHPVSCVDCHDPQTMSLRVTRPAFQAALVALAGSGEQLPHLPSVERWRTGKRDRGYDANALAGKSEMRTLVCAQCHVEYYFHGDGKRVTYPWAEGLKADAVERYYDRIGFADWTHPGTGAALLKAQHPEFETWGQGVHARVGVSCADCHMPAARIEGETVTDHHVRSPLVGEMAACTNCHRGTAAELKARVEGVQDRTRKLLDRAGADVVGLIDAVMAARDQGVPDERLGEARRMHRQAQWRVDFVGAENSTGFHASGEADRLLNEAIELARRGRAATPPSDAR